MSHSKGWLDWALCTQLSQGRGRGDKGGKGTYVKANDFLENKCALSRAERRNDHLCRRLGRAPEETAELPREGNYDSFFFEGGSAFRQIRGFRISNAFSSKSLLCQMAYFGMTSPDPLYRVYVQEEASVR